MLNVRIAHEKSGGTYGAPRVQRELGEEGIHIDAKRVTYVQTWEGCLYLAVVLDLALRRYMGWAIRDILYAELATSAVTMATMGRRPGLGLIHHSDRGRQHACAAYRAFLEQHGMRAIMSRKGNCWDNAVAESLFSTVELELIAQPHWATRGDARRAIFRFIEGWPIRERRHSTLDRLRSPRL